MVEKTQPRHLIFYNYFTLTPLQSPPITHTPSSQPLRFCPFARPHALQIGHIRRPHMKYSKGLLDLINAEESLVRLKQYDDAKNVRRMIDRILPGEEVRCWARA